MGCRDQGSNFNALVWYDGRWGCSSGGPSIKAPTRELVAEKVSQQWAPEEWYIYQDGDAWRARPLYSTVCYRLAYQATTCTDDGSREHIVSWTNAETVLSADDDTTALAAMRRFCIDPPQQCYCHTSQRRPWELVRQAVTTGGAEDITTRSVLWPRTP